MFSPWISMVKSRYEVGQYKYANTNENMYGEKQDLHAIDKSRIKEGPIIKKITLIDQNLIFPKNIEKSSKIKK